MNRVVKQKRQAYCNGLASVGPSVCPIGILTVTYQGAACDAASVHFDLTIRTDTLVSAILRCTKMVSSVCEFNRR